MNKKVYRELEEFILGSRWSGAYSWNLAIYSVHKQFRPSLGDAENSVHCLNFGQISGLKHLALKHFWQEIYITIYFTINVENSRNNKYSILFSYMYIPN